MLHIVTLNTAHVAGFLETAGKVKALGHAARSSLPGTGLS